MIEIETTHLNVNILIAEIETDKLFDIGFIAEGINFNLNGLGDYLGLKIDQSTSQTRLHVLGHQSSFRDAVIWAYKLVETMFSEENANIKLAS